MSDRTLDRSEASRRCAVRKPHIEIDARNPPRSDTAHRPRGVNHGAAPRTAEPAARVVRNAGRERRDEQLDRRRSGVVSAVATRLVHQQLVASYRNAVAIAAGPHDGQLASGFR